jgi:CSLREA domain-containing protein
VSISILQLKEEYVMNIMKLTKLILFCIAGVILLSQGVEAKTFKVNSPEDLVDASPGDGVCAAVNSFCTLRAAIQEANALAGADKIILQAKKYYLGISGTAENASATGDLDITDNLTIKGVSAAKTIINGNALDRVFQIIGPVTVKFIKLSVQNGLVADSAGGIFNQGGRVTLISCSVANNLSIDGTGGGIVSTLAGSSLNIKTSFVINNSVVTGTMDAYGGGIVVDHGTLSILDSKVAYNSATSLAGSLAAGGGIVSIASAGVTIANSEVTANRVISYEVGAGGGIALTNDSAPAVISRTSVSMNSNVSYSGIALGGGVYTVNETATFSTCSIKSNTANGAPQDGGHGGGIAASSSSVTVKNGSAVVSNMASFEGGGILNLGGSTITVSNDSRVSNNMPDDMD